MYSGVKYLKAFPGDKVVTSHFGHSDRQYIWGKAINQMFVFSPYDVMLEVLRNTSQFNRQTVPLSSHINYFDLAYLKKDELEKKKLRSDIHHSLTE